MQYSNLPTLAQRSGILTVAARNPITEITCAAGTQIPLTPSAQKVLNDLPAPDVYSPNYLLVDEPTVKFCRAESIKIIPWTVNEISDLERMKMFSLDGIITDYPNRAIKVFRR